MNLDDKPVVVTIGNPNTGKSTLFNALTGLRQQVSNFPGVTVEQVSGTAKAGGIEVTLVDVPGTYSLTAQSPDEIIAVDVLEGNVAGLARPDLAIIVVDATNLRRNLFLATQVLEAEIPVVVALNMVDRLEACGITINVPKLQNELGVKVIPVSAAKDIGIDVLREEIESSLISKHVPSLKVSPKIELAITELVSNLSERNIFVNNIELRRAFIDKDSHADQRLTKRYGERFTSVTLRLRNSVGNGRSIAAIEARDRYSWINSVLKNIESIKSVQRESAFRFVDRAFNHPLIGSLLFVLIMGAVFQAVFAWSAPFIDNISQFTGWLSVRAEEVIGPSLLASFISNGVIGGVGSVIVFLPQILILFTFIIILEDSGYISRAAFLMDKLMRGMGLSGQSFIPMLSSFACAVPGIMGTRIIANKHDRLATILAAPFMTCAARLPVYSLLIGAFIPNYHIFGGIIYLQGLVLLGLYLLGIVGGALTAWLISRIFWSRKKSGFLLEMPPYRLPSFRSICLKLWSRATTFLKRAGTIIFAISLVIWLLASFPQNSQDTEIIHDRTPALVDSYLGKMGRTVSPLFTPLGWDWKVTAAVIASFPAREVVIAALGTIYAVDVEADQELTTLSAKIRAETHADGRPVYTIPMVLGLLIFYALCLQCMATVAVIKKETGSWGWASFSWVYMTSLGYLGALMVYQIGSSNLL
jgi:ferrous iron transport protein B